MSHHESDFVPSSHSPVSEQEYALGRVPGTLYTSKSFANANPHSSDCGRPSRFAYQVFDDDGTASSLARGGEEWIVTPVAGSRYQVKVLISREAGALVDLWIQKVSADDGVAAIKEVLRLRREDAIRLAEFFRRLMLIEPDGADTGVRLDEQTVSDLLNRPDSARRVYEQQAPVLRALIADDEHAQDVVATAGRRKSLREFERMLEDESYFDGLVESGKGNGKEAVWQEFFETNPWILGVGLGTQLLTSWSDKKLEQVVAGYSVAGEGKRADALLRTSGIIQSMVFAEIKHHRTSLLGTEYRPGVWAMSKELAGGISQSQVTVHQALASLGEQLTGRDADGFETGDLTYLLRPRSFLIVGRLSEFVNDAGHHHPAKVRSFELARRHLQEPEIITFDELLARAKWIVDNSVSASGRPSDPGAR
ncbi:Shedu immune nuclease family protein [Microbacterium sp. zg.Y909]|uniref:Shedu immune nuclease family protein n=1 Tax=Microbacterium sp. zg.Y909 TaxID=2969413 RepID=UPI00214CB345|nr:Shedu immune nuclease family protein [Microbacterium sp. zg.Y909]MCR2825372.1 DUF4263 domain-containing protein [Microbacterium sp. zg.Y909]